MKRYDKLIRDRIPEIIDEDGRYCKTRVLNDKEYLAELNKKLQEELDEYKESGSFEELADLEEIIHAIVLYKGTSIDKFEKIRQEKRSIRGGFEEKIYLENVFDFNDVWNEIINKVHAGDVIYTLMHHAPNTIVDINEKGIIVKTNGNEPKLVQKEWIKTTWDVLYRNRQMVAGDIPGRARYRSSFIMALLTKLDGVRYVNNTTTILYYEI